MKTKTITPQAFLLFLASIIVMGLGISLISNSNIGTTAITSPPFVISHILPIQFGQATIIFNLLYIAIQIVLLREHFPKIQYLQLVVSFVLGWSIDFWNIFVGNLSLNTLPFQLIAVIVGCFIMAISIIMQLRADVINAPGEGIVRAIALRLDKQFGDIKIIFDSSLVLLAVVISLVAFQKIIGVGIGTVISAFLIGWFIRLIEKILSIQKG